MQQVVSAPEEKRDELLKDLEQFAFRGVPNLGTSNLSTDQNDKVDSLPRAESFIVSRTSYSLIFQKKSVQKMVFL